jgi:ferredoxin-NADP reductase
LARTSGWAAHRRTPDRARGYQAARSYSVAAPTSGDRIEITAQRVPDGEVSSYLADKATNGDTVEVRGPVGGRFVWKPDDSAPVLLVASGSGVVPLMAMNRRCRRDRTNRLTSFRRPESAQRRSLVDRPDELLNPTQGALVAGATSDESPPGQDSDGESNRTGRGYRADSWAGTAREQLCGR